MSATSSRHYDAVTHTSPPPSDYTAFVLVWDLPPDLAYQNRVKTAGATLCGIRHLTSRPQTSVGYDREVLLYATYYNVQTNTVRYCSSARGVYVLRENEFFRRGTPIRVGKPCVCVCMCVCVNV